MRTILREVDPYVFDETVHNLQVVAIGGGRAEEEPETPSYTLPLQVSTVAAEDADHPNAGKEEEDRPYFETSFNVMEEAEKDRTKGNLRTKTSKKYRRPWSHKQEDKKDDNNDPELRDFEQAANELWDVYRHLYYGPTAIGAVYVRRQAAVSATNTAPHNAKPKAAAASSSLFEVFFGIHNTCRVSSAGTGNIEDGENEEQMEVARWESSHMVTISAVQNEPPTPEPPTCEYVVTSKIWCRFSPQDVGDVVVREVAVPSSKVNNTPPAAAKPPPPSLPKTNALNVARLEMFDKAKDNWDSRHTKKKEDDHSPERPFTMKKKKEKPPPDRPAVVQAAAYYDLTTIKRCPVVVGKGSGGRGSSKSPTTASHLRNIGTLLEKLETDIRIKLERVDVPKTCETVQSLLSSSRTSTTSSSSSRTMTRRLPTHHLHHATGRGVGASLIEEIAVKAQAKGLGGTNSSSTSKSTTSSTGPGPGGIHQALESILASHKKPATITDATTTTTKTHNWRSTLKNTTTSERRSPPASSAAVAAAASSGRTLPPATPEFMKLRNQLKPASSSTN